MAWGDQGRSHYAYAAGSWSAYYWNPANNPGATFELCMANCTTYAYGRVMENGLPAPVTQFRNANNWHNYVNSAGGWSALSYTNGMSLLKGDIVEWSANHVAVVETNGTNPYVSGSWYTDDNGRATGDRSHSVMGFTLNQVSSWMISNYPNRFYHYNSLATESSTSGGGLNPTYVLRCTSTPSGGGSPAVSFSPSSYTATMSANETYLDFEFTVTVTGIPTDSDASDGISFSSNCYRYAYTTNWSYTNYTYNGTTYRKGVRSLRVRHDRQSNSNYTTTCYMYYNKTFSNGTASGNAPMYITGQAIPSIDEQMIELINKVKKRKKKWFYSKIF